MGKKMSIADAEALIALGKELEILPNGDINVLPPKSKYPTIEELEESLEKEKNLNRKRIAKVRKKEYSDLLDIHVLGRCDTPCIFCRYEFEDEEDDDFHGGELNPHSLLARLKDLDDEVKRKREAKKMKPKVIRIAQWALENMVIDEEEIFYVAHIRLITRYGQGETMAEAVLMLLECTLELYEAVTEQDESYYAGPALEQRKLLISLFGEHYEA